MTQQWPMLKIEGLQKKSILYVRQTINKLAANALEFLYLHIKKVFGDKSEFHLYLLQK